MMMLTRLPTRQTTVISTAWSPPDAVRTTLIEWPRLPADPWMSDRALDRVELPDAHAVGARRSDDAGESLDGRHNVDRTIAEAEVDPALEFDTCGGLQAIPRERGRHRGVAGRECRRADMRRPGCSP